MYDYDISIVYIVADYLLFAWSHASVQAYRLSVCAPLGWAGGQEALVCRLASKRPYNDFTSWFVAHCWLLGASLVESYLLKLTARPLFNLHCCWGHQRASVVEPWGSSEEPHRRSPSQWHAPRPPVATAPPAQGEPGGETKKLKRLKNGVSNRFHKRVQVSNWVNVCPWCHKHCKCFMGQHINQPQ